MVQRILPIGEEQVRFTIHERHLVGTGWSGTHLLEAPPRHSRIERYGDAELAHLWAWRWSHLTRPGPAERD
ncbi:MAG TPA: hypothetical protein VJ957_05365 [Longimicrobiales bacterium]|nr:hypothetical protein [Longimicrobiales bacterium]